MIYTKIKEFLENKKIKKEEIINSILDMLTDDEKKIFKKSELETLSVSELKELKETLKDS